MNDKLDLLRDHVQELEDRFEKRMTSLSKRIAQLELENLPDDDEEEEEMTPFQTAIDILSGRITELEAKLNETQGLLYTTRKELEGKSRPFFNSEIADIPLRLKALEDFRAEAEKVHIQLEMISMPNKDSILKRMKDEQ